VREARKRAQALYQTASALQRGKLFPDVESLISRIMVTYGFRTPHKPQL
jgi:hypothetical protein